MRRRCVASGGVRLLGQRLELARSIVASRLRVVRMAACE
jgi:hypothetical protein